MIMMMDDNNNDDDDDDEYITRILDLINGDSFSFKVLDSLSDIITVEGL